MVHERFICPVGQGGFSIEIIDGFVVVYDCGSTSSPQMVESCVDYLARHTDHVDLLFISHFDKDHVNTLRYLLSTIQVKRAVTSMIPKELKWCYGVYTNGAYTTIMDLLEEYVPERDRIGENEIEERGYTYNSIWEWISRSMMTQADFNGVKVQLQAAGIDLGQIENAGYVEQNKETINNAFKIYFGLKGPNAKGLIMLSQHCKDVETEKSLVGRAQTWYRTYWIINDSDVSSCLYVGDADMRNRANNAAIQKFLNSHRTEKELQLMQVPHHGSRYNVGTQFENDYPARFYFVNDSTTKRLQGNNALYKYLTTQKKLLVARDVCKDVINTETRIK